jgi:hypothetical protein
LAFKLRKKGVGAAWASVASMKSAGGGGTVQSTMPLDFASGSPS